MNTFDRDDRERALEVLCETYPKAFFSNPRLRRPLKHDILHDIKADLAAHPDAELKFYNIGTRLGLRKARILLELLDFALEFRFVLKAIVTGQATHDLAAFPIFEDTAQVFASNSSYGREVALPDLVLNDDAVRSDAPPKMNRQFEQREGNATSQR
jgi:hypothetical protein